MISSLELAKICGVSQGTVDRALHNRKGVSEKTKEKILEAAGKYGYRPHPGAREIMTGVSTSVGAVVPRINSPFFMDLMSAIKDKLFQNKHRFLLTPVEDTDELLQVLDDFSSRRYCATLVIPPEDNLKIDKTITKNMKLISLLSPCQGKNTFFVTPDEEQTGIDAVRYLISKGHTRILHLTYKREAYAIKARMNGYLKEMDRNNFNTSVLRNSEETKLLGIIRKKKITAVFCHNDWMALSVIRILERNGFNVPGDISVMGVDHSPTFAFINQDITTMEYPYCWIADQVTRIIVGNRNGFRDKPPQFKIITGNTA